MNLAVITDRKRMKKAPRWSTNPPLSHEYVSLGLELPRCSFIHSCPSWWISWLILSFFSAIYGSPKPTERKFFWQDLSAIMMNMSLPWLLAGDGNATITSEDRKGGARGTRPSSSSFQNFVQMKGLIDFCYVGTNYTWRRGTRLARLDRALASDEWATLFPDSVIHHLPKLKLTGVSLSTLTVRVSGVLK